MSGLRAMLKRTAAEPDQGRCNNVIRIVERIAHGDAICKGRGPPRPVVGSAW
jgi:hypothetical protein